MKRPKKRAGTGHWHWPDREWLEHQHFKMGKPYKQIAREIGISKEAVLNWVEKLEVSVWNVIPKGKLHPPVRVGTGAGKRFYGLTREWLIDEYIHKDKSMWQIADEIGATAHAIMVWLRKHNVQSETLMPEIGGIPRPCLAQVGQRGKAAHPVAIRRGHWSNLIGSINVSGVDIRRS